MSKVMLPCAGLLAATLASAAAGDGPEKGPEAPRPPAFQVPKDWKAIENGPFVSARFQVGKGDRAATVMVAGLAGDGGGLAANVNRYRRQVGLEALDEQDALRALKPVKVNGLAGHSLDVTGPDTTEKAAERILAVVVRQGERTWFFKMAGPASLVGEQVAAFEGFINSVRFEK
jgi:hypothetical protein